MTREELVDAMIELVSNHRYDDTDNDLIDSLGDLLNNSHKAIYDAGRKAGITNYAWWKDGVQYVGTTGRTLKEALEEVQ